MSDSDRKKIKQLLSLSEVQKVTANANAAALERRSNIPPVCDVFTFPYTKAKPSDNYRFYIDKEAHRKLPDIIDQKVLVLFPKSQMSPEEMAAYHKKQNVGIVFSGGPAPGGHNVIAGLFDALRKANPDSRLFGFQRGFDGVVEKHFVEITAERIDQYRNSGGFGMIKTGRTKIDSRRKLDLSRQTCRELKLDALIVVGGDDSNTNAAFLAQEMYADGIQVIGVPKTIDGDIQVRDADGKTLCAISFGFHSAARAFSENISNLCTDCNSDMKYWHICKVMGRVASHLALEVALQTHANITLIGEDLADYVDASRLEAARDDGKVDFTAYGMTLRHLSRVICDAITRRAAVGKNCGVLVLPEGVLEFINEIQLFIIKLNTIIAHYNSTHDDCFHASFPVLEDKVDYLRQLARSSREEGGIHLWHSRDDELFNDIPEFFQEGLLTERDSHGNFQFSQVPTEKVLMELVRDYLDILREKGLYRIGISRSYFKEILSQDDLDSELFGSAMFENWKAGDQYLLLRNKIISLKILLKVLGKKGVLGVNDGLPSAVKHIFAQSVPSFKTQTHFYGYDGRGSNPTRFDLNYTYNLGLTVFNLVANGATGHMAAIRNLEKGFSHWEPIGIPIAPLMHMEERKGKLELVLEKSVVDVNSTAFQIVKELRDKWLSAKPGDDNYRKPGPIHFADRVEEDRPMTLVLNALATETI